MITLNEAVKVLAELRDLEGCTEARVREAQIALDNSFQAEHLRAGQDRLRQVKSQIAEVAKIVREKAVTTFRETKNKHPHPAVTVALYTVLRYPAAKALAWACEHLPAAVKLIKAKFEKVAKEAELPWVTISKEPRAKIASDLSKYLED